MVLAQKIYKSTKSIGEYEEKIIQTLSKHFRSERYATFPHSSLNIAWGSIISDIDLLLVKGKSLTCIEVKSSRDNLARAKQQIDAIQDYVDFVYVATDRRVKNWENNNAGLIHVKGDEINIIKNAKRLSNKPRQYSIMTLKRNA